MNAQQLVQETSKLMSLPEVYLRIKQILEDPKAGMDEVAEVIARDPGIAARLLKIANSAFFGLPSKVDNVSKATNLLGADRIHDLVLSTTMTRAFSRIPEQVMNMDIFWQNSIYCAVLAQLLGKYIDRDDYDRLFLQGLLFDVGHLVMYSAVPDLCRSALSLSSMEGAPLHQVEQQLIGCDYADVGGELLHLWGLPECLYQVVRHQTSPPNAGEYDQMARVVGIARLIVDSADPDTPMSERPFELDNNSVFFPKLSEEVLHEVKKEADKNAMEALTLIFPGQGVAA